MVIFLNLALFTKTNYFLHMNNYWFYFFFIIIINSTAAQNQFSVYFDSNKFDLKATEISKLNDWISVNKDVKIVGVHGFCDEDGSVLLNDTLSKRRINTVFNIIKSKIAIRDDFKSRSFGELHQLFGNKAENRKVTLFYIEKKDLDRENEILKIKTNIADKNFTASILPEKNYPEKLSIENPDGSKSEFNLDIAFMKKVAATPKGEKLKIDNLNFNFNTFSVTNDSRSKLYELLVVLEQNPNLKIEIQGHICCNPNPKEVLSTQRAKAVYGFLTYNKIAKNRLQYKGLGSTQPINPLPEKNEAERAANRRVEILIVENSL